MTIEYKNHIELKPGERIDDLERNGYGIIQNTEGFCFGMDAVLLSGFAKVKKNDLAVDLGTGTGIIPLLLEAKSEGRHFYGVEIQPAMAEMAGRSVKLNGLEDKIDIVLGDIKQIAENAKPEDAAEAADTEAAKHLQRFSYAEFYGRVDVVTCNPPYMKSRHGLQNPNDSKAIARHEVLCSLQDVCRAASRLLKSGGRFYMVHRPLRLPEIISEMKAVKLEPKRIRPVYPFVDKEANMILIEAVKAAGPECRFEKPLIVYKADGSYNDEIYDIYGY